MPVTGIPDRETLGTRGGHPSRNFPDRDIFACQAGTALLDRFAHSAGPGAPFVRRRVRELTDSALVLAPTVVEKLTDQGLDEKPWLDSPGVSPTAPRRLVPTTCPPRGPRHKRVQTPGEGCWAASGTAGDY